MIGIINKKVQLISRTFQTNNKTIDLSVLIKYYNCSDKI
jgi:hypothetical protein